MRNTVDFRRKRAVALAKSFALWITMTDEALFAEVKKSLPTCSEATRDECLKYLAMSVVYDMIPAEVFEP